MLGTSIEELWQLGSSAPLTDEIILEVIRGVMLWIIWNERNRNIFKRGVFKSFITLESNIISLSSFWCKSKNNNKYLKFKLVLPSHVEDFTLPVSHEEEEEEVQQFTLLGEVD